MHSNHKKTPLEGLEEDEEEEIEEALGSNGGSHARNEMHPSDNSGEKLRTSSPPETKVDDAVRLAVIDAVQTTPTPPTDGEEEYFTKSKKNSGMDRSSGNNPKRHQNPMDRSTGSSKKYRHRKGGGGGGAPTSGDQSVASHVSSVNKRSIIGSIFRISREVDNDRAVIHVRRPSSTSTMPAGSSPPQRVSFCNEEQPEETEATWNDVCRACCCHTGQGWIRILGFFAMLLFLLYFFLVGLDLLGTSFKVVGGCTAGSLLGSDTNPLAAVMIGIIATVLLQSSSTTTAVIVSLVSGGLDVEQGIYMVMGANVGTSVTCMLVSLAHIGDREELERAFSGASVLYVFNFLTLCILFPLEIGTEYLYKFTKLMLPESVKSGDSWEGPIKKIVSPLVKRFIIANNELIDDISTGAVESCSDVYPVYCIDDIETYETCTVTGVIACDKKSGSCPVFFQSGASKKDDMVSGWVCLIFALAILIICLIALVALLRKMLLGASTKILYKATNINPYLAMLIGCGVTVLVQSSSITTSTLVPLAGIGVLGLENMYPLVIGADVGTTFTALMAAMVSSEVESLQIALVHFWFNITGLLIWYPIPFMRRIVLRISVLLGKATGAWKGFPIFFIIMMFIVLPLLLLGIGACFEQQKTGFTALGMFLVLIAVLGVLYFVVWWRCWDGKHKCRTRIEKRQRRAAAMEALADDLDYLKVDTEWCKNEIGRIKDFAGHLQKQQTAIVLDNSRMEEGRPMIPTVAADNVDDEDEGEFVTENDEILSTYESCRSKPWRDVLYLSAGSIRSGIQGSASVNFFDTVD